VLWLLVLLVAESTAEPVKKQTILDEKEQAAAHPAHKIPPPAKVAVPVLSLYNAWTREVLPVPADKPPPAPEVSHFLRCHFTNQFCTMDPRLIPIVQRAATRFRASRIEVVSGFRSPKYNLFLRKKGHEVARDSEHPRGEAIDFRIPQVPTRTLLRFVRSLRLGGVGYYPESHFVHADVGRVRFWRGH
jgi:Bacterial protein of unknown function (DUF882)